MSATDLWKDPVFTWPAYVTVETKWRKVHCHASRFVAVAVPVPEVAA